jgi:phage gp29-like protein
MAHKRKIPQQQNFEKWSPETENKKSTESLDVNLVGGHHFATRERANEFSRLMRSLPDPDPILRRMGRSITVLQELLIDSHLESVWSIRCAAASGTQWFIAPAEGGGKREQEAADSFALQFKALDVPRIIEEMMDAVAYGYAPLEIIWQADGELWGIENIVGKPPQWFEFDADNRLVFSGGRIAIEPLPENRFLLVQHRPTYLNPYGDKAFSKCFWPATFKRKGWEWWTVFVEKYGGAFLYGRYPANFSQKDRDDLMAALEAMIADAVAIIPEGSEITIEALANKGSVSNVHLEYINAANAEISKAVLGQTLTTELGGKTGSYAAAQTHNLVRKDLAAADRYRISAAFDRLARVYTAYNFGADVMPPVFKFVEDEELYTERIERDLRLHSIGWRPTRAYIAREYEMQEEDFKLAGDEEVKEQVGTFSQTRSCLCGKNEKRNLFTKLKTALFAAKGEKVQSKDEKLMAEFEKSQLRAGQNEVNKIVESFVDALGMVSSYEEVQEVLMAAYDTADVERLASLIDEMRYAAAGIGGAHG